MKISAALLLVCAACAGKPDVPILNYHSVGNAADAFTVDEPAFRQQLDWLIAAGFRTVSLHDVLERQNLKHAVVITFDDGTEDALTRVLPALRRRGLHGTFFIVTGFVGRPGYLTWDGVRALAAAGMEIGSHGVDHARLSDLPDDRVRDQLAVAKRDLEAQLHRPIELFAYPYNAVRPRLEKAAAEVGYRAAVAGVVHGGADRYSLYRFSVTRETTLTDFQRAVLR